VVAFEQVVCWNDPAVLAATPRDAASLPKAQFRAVHHPLRLLKRPLGQRTGGQWTTEDQLSAVLAGPVSPDGYLLVPVVGGAGTGKSHLVRWVHDSTVGTDAWEVRYLAKNRTSIRRVIEIIIEGQEGEAFERARDALDSAPAQHEGADTLAERLLDELALIVSEPIEHATSVDPVQRQLLDKLARELPDVLRDPVVRRRFVAADGVVQRLVGLATEGRRDGDGLDDDAMRIYAEDLPLAFEELADASKGAKDLLGKLASIAKLRSGAVDLINSALHVAVKRIFVSANIDMIEVLRDLRRTLHLQGRELVLFVEDLTVLHGVEEEFLDALVEPAVSPEGRLCNLRVLFAVTEHHFDGLDTVRTRCEDAYWLDSPYGDQGMSEDEVVSFLARYLNVARLEADLPASETVVNACSSCLQQPECHPTFGASDEGFGLYPFNRPAIRRLVESCSPERFDPRAIVRSLVARFLLAAHAEVDQHTFPSADLLEPFDRHAAPLDPFFTSRLGTDRHGDQEPVANLARFWSDNPPLVNDDVLAAFGYPPIDRSGLAPPPEPPGPKPPGPKPPGPAPEPGPEFRLPVAEQAAYSALTAWAGGNQSLPAAATLLVRRLVHGLVLKNLDGGAVPVNLGNDFAKDRFALADILVERSDTVQTNPTPAIRIEPSPEAATAIQGLLLLGGEILGDHTERYRPFAASATERWVEDAVRHLQGQQSDASLVAAVQGLALCAALAGAVRIGDDPPTVLAQLFQPPSSVVAPEAPGLARRTTRWTRLLESASSAFPELDRRVRLTSGESRGASGGVRAVHADLLVPMIAKFTKDWRFESSDPVVDRLMRQVEPAVDAEWTALRLQVELALPLVDLERPWRDQVAAVRDVLVEASRAGRLPDLEAVAALDAINARASERSQTSLAKAHDMLAADPPLIDRLAFLTTGVPDDVNAVADFVRRASTALDGLESELDTVATQTSEDGDLPGVVDLALAGIAAFQSDVEDLAR
jgi:hypothetical protein